jgi:hypothetical protein
MGKLLSYTHIFFAFYFFCGGRAGIDSPNSNLLTRHLPTTKEKNRSRSLMRNELIKHKKSFVIAVICVDVTALSAPGLKYTQVKIEFKIQTTT